MAAPDASLMATVRGFWPVLRPQRPRLARAICASLVATGLATLAPIPVKIIIDDVLAGRNMRVPLLALEPWQLVLTLAAATALLTIFSAIFAAVEKMISARVREQMTLDLRLLCLDRLMLLTPLCRGDDRSGELGLRLVDDVQQVVRLFTKTGPVILRYLLTLLFTLGALFWIAPAFGIAAAAIAILLGLVIRLAARPLALTAAAKRLQEGRVAAAAQEILRSLSFIQASGAETEIRGMFAAANQRSLAAGVAETGAAVHLERRMQIANGLAVALLVGSGGWLALRGQVSAGDLALAVIYLNQMLRPIEKMNELASAVSGATSRAARLSELLNRDERLPRTGSFTAKRAQGRITLAAPEFAYPDGPALGFADVTIPPRSLVSIEGPSGAGKSTLIALLTRLFDPEHGSIQLDERDYRDWELASLRSQFAVSPQSPPLMAGTVRQWLRLGGVDVDETALWRALQSVGLAEMLLARGGLDAELGEAGAGFSGGEQARLALARALVADRPVLLLDEPFANVDAESARVMLRALADERGRRTIVIVTHQPLPARFADLRLRIEDGAMSVLEQAGKRASA